MKRMGLVKCNDRLEVVKVKPAYYTVQNVASVFDASVVAETLPVEYRGEIARRATGLYTFRQKGSDIPLVAYWNASMHPENDNRTNRALILLPDYMAFADPVLVDMITGAIYAVPAVNVSVDGHAKCYDLPIYDAPLVLTEKNLVVSSTTGE